MNPLRRTPDRGTAPVIVVPDDPIAAIHRTVLWEIHTTAIHTAQGAGGNSQLELHAVAVSAAENFEQIRHRALRALRLAKTNRVLADFALDVLNQVRGL